MRNVLIGLVAIAMLPTWAFAGFVAYRYGESRREAVEADGRAKARSITAALDFRLDSVEASMAALALSQPLATKDMATFYWQARSYGDAKQVTIILIDSAQRQVVNTNLAPGGERPLAPPELLTADASSGNGRRYSRLFWDETGRDWLVALVQPVQTNDGERFLLAIGLRTASTFGRAIEASGLPDGWIASVSDEARVIMTRHPDPQTRVGQPLHPEVLAVVGAGHNGWGAGTARDGSRVYVAYAHSTKSDWLVLVGVPATMVDGAILEGLRPVALGGLLVLLATLAIASMVARRIARQISGIAATATAFRQRSELAQAQGFRIHELAELGATFRSASIERSRNEAELHRLLSEKDLLMQEVHHRVKNSLQLVRGILSLQARSAPNPAAREALKAAATRIVTVADVHHHLYQGASTVEVNVRLYLDELGNDLSRSLLDSASSSRRILVEAPDAMWPADNVINLGLITTELVTNAIKYGQGNVCVSLVEEKDGTATLTVDDEGEGFPADYEIGNGGGLGSKLIQSLVRPEVGSIAIDRNVAHGRVVVRLSRSWRRPDPSTAESAGP